MCVCVCACVSVRALAEALCGLYCCKFKHTLHLLSHSVSLLVLSMTPCSYIRKGKVALVEQQRYY